ncbi:3-oxosteroid 1-dehydrogenase [Rhodococcus sp. BP-252]|nr:MULTISPECIES: 3-oxosteroid 1-dehydrogenase [Rhodococcus]MBY6413196.1 3-oxosteroid 1-dehydrogenase [Rhodococcus sp. BP-320]MBY6418675.1 3-oxosteroid 1-dehydrogenase [Rhodococcus sp. BP-321]MBY6422969.1 3-oxosteroid 1-dehydrogenase [Rhodococcus sp. BP-324]MBY6427939.1 3-oxosteroid 1-dehydrogenase [Rhodococcus sp. BP-323]MBY6433117.1 3-oxosteroid 1-dehydrogenase [Rhodococcus sp. BP-322]
MITEDYDIVVVGSGAGGMTAALTAAHRGLSVVVVEKASHFGGSTARSGGGVWIPGNEALEADGVDDTPEAAREYLHSIIGDVVSKERIDTYLERGPEMLSFVLRHSPLRMQWVPGYSDYYPEAPGGRVGGRSVEPTPFDASCLGPMIEQLEPDYGKAPLNVVLTQADYRTINLLRRHPSGIARVGRVGMRWLRAKLTGQHLLGRGQALAAALRAGLLDAGVPVLLGTAMTDLVVEDGQVRGTVCGERTFMARKGVVLASGGFEHNEEMRTKYQRQPIGTEWTVGAKANTGDGIRAGQKLGAATDLMDDAWWGPSIPLTGGPWFCIAERTLPGGIMVNASGRRFLNEAAPYVEAVHRMYGGEYGVGDGPGENIPTWMIIDQRYRDRYIFAGLQPKKRFPSRWLKAGVVVEGSTITELAEKTGLPAENLTATIQRFNGFARTGVDEDFGRGDSGYDKYYGDPTNTPNPSLGALDKPPFYAVKMVPGDLGTKGGLVTDADARVLRDDGSVIDGLYAVGNASAPVMGHTYAGPGATIGPAMTFAYLAVLDMAGRDMAGRDHR